MEWPSSRVDEWSIGLFGAGFACLALPESITMHPLRVAIVCWVASILIFICGFPAVQGRLRAAWGEVVGFYSQAVILSPHAAPIGVGMLAMLVVALLIVGGRWWLLGGEDHLPQQVAQEQTLAAPMTIGKYVCTADLIAEGGRHALLVEFGVLRGQTNGLAIRIDFESPYEKVEAWTEARLRTDKPAVFAMIHHNRWSLEDPSRMFYQERFQSPSLTPRQSYYLYFEAEKSLRIKSLFFIEDYSAVSDQIRMSTLAKQVDMCPR